MDILKLYDIFGIETGLNKNKFFFDFENFIKETNVTDLNDYKDIEESIEYDETLKHYRKYSYCLISSRFIKYLNENDLIKYKTKFNDMYLKKERTPQIIKLIQNNPMRIDDLAEYFHVDSRTIRRNLEFIEEGMLDIDSDTNFSVIRNKGVVSIVSTDKYKTTMHPITLNLNLTELYTLLIDVAERERYNKFSGQVYDLIMRRIYSQLSDYAKGIIDAHKDVISYKGNGNSFISEEELHKRFKMSMIMSALKSGCKVNVGFKDNGVMCFDIVKIKKFREGKYMLLADSGEKYICSEDDIVIVKEILDF